MKKLKIFIITSAIIFVISITIFITNSSYKEKLSSNNNPPKASKSYNNALSIMLETGSNTNEYEASTSTSWPTEGYEFNKELSRCENGGELSFDEETKKLQLISDKPEKCYAYFDKYLEFYLDDVLFTAKPSMTWEEWLDSNYSDNWSYKGTFLTFLESDYIANKNNMYYPISCEKSINDNLLLVTPRNGVKYNALALYTDSYDVSLNYGTYSGCANQGDAYGCDCYSNHPFIIKRTNKIKQQLQNVDEGYFEFFWGEPWKAYTEDNKYYTYRWGVMCLTPETLIDVEEIDEKGKKRRRRKKLKDIKVGDKVICINPETLELDTDTVIECDGQMNKKHICYDNWYFSDGTIITTIHRHRFYNVEKNKFMYMEEWNNGEHGLNINNEKIELIKHEHIEEEINHCTLFTEKYNNYFANGLLSGNRKSKEIKL